MKYYHVTQSWDGGDLESLYNREGDDAYEIFAKRWPESGGMAYNHINLIHLHDNISDAERFVRDFGGEILEIELEEDDVEIDDLEYPHPVSRYPIDSYNIRRLYR